MRLQALLQAAAQGGVGDVEDAPVALPPIPAAAMPPAIEADVEDAPVALPPIPAVAADVEDMPVALPPIPVAPIAPVPSAEVGHPVSQPAAPPPAHALPAPVQLHVSLLTV